ncbi:MAG: hypothetical protein CM15mP32_6610 [Flavobacteriaceae bacterium]|nr:MAG: hypothetical protein CM15mP32_6610 [Flavobacteriaceae bacterium]
MMLGQNENQEELQLIQQKYGFDQPIFIQYLNYLNDLSPISDTHNSTILMAYPPKIKLYKSNSM